MANPVNTAQHDAEPELALGAAERPKISKRRNGGIVVTQTSRLPYVPLAENTSYGAQTFMLPPPMEGLTINEGMDIEAVFSKEAEMAKEQRERDRIERQRRRDQLLPQETAREMLLRQQEEQLKHAAEASAQATTEHEAAKAAAVEKVDTNGRQPSLEAAKVRDEEEELTDDDFDLAPLRGGNGSPGPLPEPPSNGTGWDEIVTWYLHPGSNLNSGFPQLSQQNFRNALAATDRLTAAQRDKALQDYKDMWDKAEAERKRAEEMKRQQTEAKLAGAKAAEAEAKEAEARAQEARTRKKGEELAKAAAARRAEAQKRSAADKSGLTDDGTGFDYNSDIQFHSYLGKKDGHRGFGNIADGLKLRGGAGGARGQSQTTTVPSGDPTLHDWYGLGYPYNQPAPSPFSSPFDWFFYHWHEWGHARVSWCMSWIIWGALTAGVCFLGYQALRGTLGVGRGWPNRSGVYNPPFSPPKDTVELLQRIHDLEKQLGIIDSKRVGEIAELRASSTSKAAELWDVQKQVSSLTRKTQRDKTDLENQLKKYIDTLEAFGLPAAWQQDIRKMVHNALPERIVTEVGRDGSLQLTKEFEGALGDVFSHYFPRYFTQEMSKINLTEGVKSVPSFDSFIELNGERLRSTIDQRIGEFEQAVLPKEAIEDLVGEHIDKFSKQWEAEMYSLGKRLDAFQAGQRGGSPAGSSGGGASPFTGVKIADYASASLGAYVWPYLTSASFDYRAHLGFIQSILGPVVYRSMARPFVALQPTLDVGDCWSFPSDKGMLSIVLAAPIHISHVSIEHLDQGRVIDRTTIPREIDFWIQISDPVKRRKVEEASLRIANASGTVTPESRRITPDSRYLGFVKVHSFVYDKESSDLTQSSELPLDLMNMNVATDLVTVSVRSNYGNKAYTCLYRARVHGYEAIGGMTERSSRKLGTVDDIMMQTPGQEIPPSKKGIQAEEPKKKKGWFFSK